MKLKISITVDSKVLEASDANVVQENSDYRNRSHFFEKAAKELNAKLAKKKK